MMPVWLQLLFLYGFPSILVIVLVAWAIDSFWLTPKESKLIKKATRKKRLVAAVGYDNGQCDLKMADHLGDEGYARMNDGWTGFLGRNVVEGNPKPDKNIERTNPLITRVFILKHAKIPFMVGYAGKAIITNPQALAIVEHAQKENSKIKLPFEIRGKQLLANVLWPVSMTVIKKVFPKSWNQSQIRALEKISELTGLLKGKKWYGAEGLKYFVLPGMIIIAIIILAIILLVLG